MTTPDSPEAQKPADATPKPDKKPRTNKAASPSQENVHEKEDIQTFAFQSMVSPPPMPMETFLLMSIIQIRGLVVHGKIEAAISLADLALSDHARAMADMQRRAAELHKQMEKAAKQPAAAKK